jgi:glycosyltransferase involved in cell wall biosynthesis
VRLWLITIGEPLPSDAHAVRLLRTGLLANLLVEQGHDVLWWSSTFDHQKKQHRSCRDAFLEIRPGLRIALLHSNAYRHNISVARIRNHRGVARKFARYAPAEAPPDIILCSFPTIELSAAAIEYGRERGTPVVIDVRDLWPDIFLDHLPPAARRLGRLALRPFIAQTCFALENASGIVAMSDGCLRWGLDYAQRDPGPYDAVFPLGYPKPVVAPDEMRAAERTLRQRGVDPKKLICWYVGMFGKTYDLATVIHAARALACRGRHDIQFVLSGDGDQRERWAQLACGLQNVVFTGWADLPQIAHMMTIAHVGLAAVDGVPQSLPNKLFEYFSAGLPVLSSLQGEAATLLAQHECGLTYAARDPSSFLKALQALVADEDGRRRLGRNAQRLFDLHYSADAVYSRMADFLTGVARPPSLVSPSSSVAGVPMFR